MEQLRRLVNSKPDSLLRPQALYELGENARQRDQPDQAIEWFKQVAERYATSEFGGPAIHGLAAVYFVKQQFGEARQWASRLIDGAFNDTLKQRGRYLRGIAYQSENSFAKAIRLVQ